MLSQQLSQQKSIANNKTEEEHKLMNQILKKNTEALEKEKSDRLNLRMKLQ